jgi:hypothetical protein
VAAAEEGRHRNSSKIKDLLKRDPLAIRTPSPSLLRPHHRTTRTTTVVAANKSEEDLFPLSFSLFLFQEATLYSRKVPSS